MGTTNQHSAQRDHRNIAHEHLEISVPQCSAQRVIRPKLAAVGPRTVVRVTTVADVDPISPLI